jgi:guanylate kinase
MNPHTPLDRQAVFFILIGPSGVGKSALRDRLCSPDLGARLVKYRPMTSRVRRCGESDEEYIFVTSAELEAAKQLPDTMFSNVSYENEFLTYWPEALPAPERYVAIYLPEAAAMIREHLPRTIIVAITPEHSDDLPERIRSRDPHISPAELRLRTSAIRDEIRAGAEVADLVFVNRQGLENSSRELLVVLDALSRT